jgi:alpha-amylase
MIKFTKAIAPLLILLISFGSACTTQEKQQETTAVASSQPLNLWPKGVTYEIFVRAFADSDGDGIGDINGMTSRLDYLKDLGVEAVWLMPIMKSPTYHKYDVVDYYAIDPEYGTMEDFKNFLSEAHKRDIKVVIDYVINHTGSDHPWFLESANNKNSPYRDFYVWADDAEVKRIGETKEGTADSEGSQQWHRHPKNDKRYFGFFWSGMPDLNYDNPAVREEMFKIGRYWLTEIGVDGFRLDAAKHIFPDGEEEKNHAFWVDFRREMEAAKPDVYLIGEVWDKAEVVAPYLKGLHAIFNFDMGYAITRVVKAEQDTLLIPTHKKIRDYYTSVSPDYVDAIFLTNHDQNRIMSELNGNMNHARMAASILLTLPGAPYLYYGEEIGMKGRKPDEQIREPFLWDTSTEGTMQTSWMKAVHSTPDVVTPVSQQQEDPNSLLNHYKNMISVRRSSMPLTIGELGLTSIKNPALTSFYRTHNNESVLVIHNISGKEVALDLPSAEKEYAKVLYTTQPDLAVRGGKINLPAYSTVLLTK